MSLFVLCRNMKTHGESSLKWVLRWQEGIWGIKVCKKKRHFFFLFQKERRKRRSGWIEVNLWIHCLNISVLFSQWNTRKVIEKIQMRKLTESGNIWIHYSIGHEFIVIQMYLVIQFSSEISLSKRLFLTFGATEVRGQTNLNYYMEIITLINYGI